MLNERRLRKAAKKKGTSPSPFVHRPTEVYVQSSTTSDFAAANLRLAADLHCEFAPHVPQSPIQHPTTPLLQH